MRRLDSPQIQCEKDPMCFEQPGHDGPCIIAVEAVAYRRELLKLSAVRKLCEAEKPSSPLGSKWDGDIERERFAERVLEILNE